MRRLLCLCLIVPAAFAQAVPQFEAGGVVNAASYAQPVSPGAIVSIFGTNLASTVAIAQGTPLPIQLAGTSVTIGGIKAPLFYVSPSQINLQVPWSTAIALFAYTPSPVVVTTAAGASAAVQVPVFQAGPSLFSQDGSGCGQAAALNVSADGSVSVNSPSNSAAPGDFISLYGTGIGAPYTPPADGTYPVGLTPLASPPGVVIGGSALPAVPWAGLAPQLIGVDQINFQIPSGTAEACAVPVAVSYGQLGVVGPTMSVSVHSGRGQCVDPPAQSYGSVTLTKTITSDTAGVTTADSVSGSFPSGPGVTIPQAPPASQPGSYTNTIVPLAMSRSCAINGQSLLSAGTITVNGAAAMPIPVPGGVQYRQSLPSGFIAPGQYTISASGGTAPFQGTMTVPAGIQIQTPLGPGTQISGSNPLVITWTGGAAGELVKLSLVGAHGLFTSLDTAYVDAAAGSFTFSPVCMGNPPPMGSGRVCAFGVFLTSGAGNLSLEVDVLPSQGYASSVNAQGLTLGVELAWMYRYVFNGLSFGP